MKAEELYEPVFLCVCKVNRLARNGVPLSYPEVRSEILSILAEIDVKSEEDPYLREQVKALRAPINYFVDDLIVQSGLPFAGKWHEERLGYEKDGLAGDEAFFDCLDATLALPPSDAVADRLAVYYTCLGLGFQGFYFNQPDKLRDYMKRIKPSIRHLMLEDDQEYLTPQAYEATDTRDFVRPPRQKTLALAASLLCLLFAAIPTYMYLHEKVRGSIPEDLKQILHSHQGDEPPRAGKGK